MSETNVASGVKNAASRKYFTPDHLWYFPPAEAFEKIGESTPISTARKTADHILRLMGKYLLQRNGTKCARNFTVLQELQTCGENSVSEWRRSD